MKIKLSEMALSKEKVNMSLREAIFMSLGDLPRTRIKTRNTMRQIEQLSQQNNIIWKCPQR